MASDFAVIQTQPEWIDPMTAARALAGVRKSPLQDQINPAKKAWGIFAEHLSQADAELLAAGLTSAGIPSQARPMAAIFLLPDATACKQWSPELTQGLTLIAAAAMKVTHTTTKTVKEGPSNAQKMLNTGILLTTGLPIKLGGKERTVEKKQESSDLALVLDLIYAAPARRLRIDAGQFDYSFLKDRKQYFGMANFKLLIADLAQAVPTAHQNHGTRVLLANTPLQGLGYETVADLERETRWLLTLHPTHLPPA